MRNSRRSAAGRGSDVRPYPDILSLCREDGIGTIRLFPGYHGCEPSPPGFSMDIGPGAEVVVPGYFRIAVSNTVLLRGAIPVICEVDETLTMDPADLQRKLGSVLPGGFPWNLPENKGPYRHEKGTCPATDDLLARSVGMSIPPDLSPMQREARSEAITMAFTIRTSERRDS